MYGAPLIHKDRAKPVIYCICSRYSYLEDKLRELYNLKWVTEIT